MIFMTSVLEEASELLESAQDYFNQFGSEDMEDLSPVDRLLYTSEMTRISLRLSAIMAWIIIQKAVFSGTITQRRALRYALGHYNICSVNNIEECTFILPSYVCYLLGQSAKLYERVQRLDEQTAYRARSVA